MATPAGNATGGRTTKVTGTAWAETHNNRTPTNTSDPDSGGGVGLENVRKRLDILYPLQHKLVIHENETTFSISLKIHLKPKI